MNLPLGIVYFASLGMMVCVYSYCYVVVNTPGMTSSFLKGNGGAKDLKERGGRNWEE